jgi:hypothetical protein
LECAGELAIEAGQRDAQGHVCDHGRVGCHGGARSDGFPGRRRRRSGERQPLARSVAVGSAVTL